MKKRFLRYAGDKAVGALLERYACPTSFHVVRTRFLGNIATPKLDASPLRTIESFWEGELPEFDNDSAANELFGSLTGLWNELAKHQSGTKPIRLTRMAAKRIRTTFAACAGPAPRSLKASSRACSVTRRSLIYPNGPMRPWTISARSTP